MGKPTGKKRLSNAERQAKLRAERDAKGMCRTCGAPVAANRRTGAPAKQCSEHLDVDRDRKTVIPLRFDDAEWFGDAVPLPWREA